MGTIKLDDTIAAISTPLGEGGIGIVRLSGKDALKIADEVFVSKNKKKPSGFKTYTVHYGYIVDNSLPIAARTKITDQGRGAYCPSQIIDEVILTVMRAPKTYTKEDVVEINCHSGIVALKKILDLVLANSARLAEPGEFTKRAFLNGRIDLLQAESVIDIIRAKTNLSLKSALNNLEGRFSEKVNSIREVLMSLLAHIEASIDFSEEDIDFAERKDILNRLKRVNRDINGFISTAHEGKVLRQGIKTVICGSPNVGKSSLMNAMLKESRAIVTHLPGTTRDTIEEIVNVKGIPIVLVDTAGIIDTEHPIEKEGIRRSYISIQDAGMILLVLDNSRKLNKNDRDVIRNIKHKGNIIIVVNKNDLSKKINVNMVKKLLPNKPIIYISAVKQAGIEKLEEKIKDTVFRGGAPCSDFVGISNDRQLDILRKSDRDVENAIQGIKEKLSMDLIAIYLRSSIENIGEITGHSITEEALDRIFAEFCIGK